MNKREFLAKLRARLSGLPADEVEERLGFWSEMIDDRIEEGLSEEDAVAAVGSAEEIAAQIISEIPLVKIAKEKLKPNRKLKAWEIVLLAVGSPIWLSLAIAAIAVMLSLYVSIWAVIVSVWASFGAVVACAFGGVVSGIGMAICATVPIGLAMVAAGLICAGVSIFLFYGCRAATTGILWLTKKSAFGIKCCFVEKEAA